MFRSSGRYLCAQKQAGFLMPVALFIIIGLGALAISISRMTGESYSAGVHTSVSVQALYAAESATQYAAHQLLFDAANHAEVEARCAATNGSTLEFNTRGLSQCRATITCNVRLVSGAKPLYELRSQGSCGGGSLMAERIIRAAVTYE